MASDLLQTDPQAMSSTARVLDPPRLEGGDVHLSPAGREPARNPVPVDASELAQGLAQILRPFPRQAIEDLERLLANNLGAPTSAELREARLGLLIELISTGDGEIPRTREYDDLRRSRLEAKGERWPSASTLVESYGSFLAAVKAAIRLHHDGSAARVPHTHRHAKPYRRYTRDEVIAALHSFHDQFGSWPRSELEYLTWGETVRRARRHGGHPDPRIPTAKPIRKLFGDFGRALEVAKVGEPSGHDHAR
jgi:hypothetical protein